MNEVEQRMKTRPFGWCQTELSVGWSCTRTHHVRVVAVPDDGLIWGRGGAVGRAYICIQVYIHPGIYVHFVLCVR